MVKATSRYIEQSKPCSPSKGLGQRQGFQKHMNQYVMLGRMEFLAGRGYSTGLLGSHTGLGFEYSALDPGILNWGCCAIQKAIKKG